MRTIFKVFIEFVTMLLLFYVLFLWPPGMWDLSFPTEGRTHTLTLEGEVPATGPPGKSLKAWLIINSIFSPSPFPGVWGMGLKVPTLYSYLGLSVTSPHPEALEGPAKSGFIRTKDAPLNQDIPRALEALCQESGTKTCIFLLITEDDAGEDDLGPPYFLLISPG